MPSSSRPIPSIFAETPTALNTTSASSVISPSGVFTFAFTPVPEVSTAVTSAAGHDCDAILFKILFQFF